MCAKGSCDRPGVRRTEAAELSKLLEVPSEMVASIKARCGENLPSVLVTRSSRHRFISRLVNN
jgi:hypothetical protein